MQRCHGKDAFLPRSSLVARGWTFIPIKPTHVSIVLCMVINAQGTLMCTSQKSTWATMMTWVVGCTATARNSYEPLGTRPIAGRTSPAATDGPCSDAFLPVSLDHWQGEESRRCEATHTTALPSRGNADETASATAAASVPRASIASMYVCIMYVRGWCGRYSRVAATRLWLDLLCRS